MAPRRCGARWVVTKMAVGAVRAADDADGTRFRRGEAEQAGEDEGDEDAQLRRRAQKQGFRVGDQGGKVRHRAHAHEDERRVDAQLDALIEVVEQSAVGVGHLIDIVEQRFAARNGHVITGLDRVGKRGEELAVHLEEFLGDQRDFLAILTGVLGGFRQRGEVVVGRLVHEAAQRQVGQQHAKGNGQKQQRLKALDDGKVEQHEGDEDHHVLLPVAIGKAGGLPNGRHAADKVDLRRFLFFLRFDDADGAARKVRFAIGGGEVALEGFLGGRVQRLLHGRLGSAVSRRSLHGVLREAPYEQHGEHHKQAHECARALDFLEHV